MSIGSEEKRFLSVIIPAYKQEETISHDLKNIQTTLEAIRYDYEMIVVVDGKVDKTFQNAQRLEGPKLKVFGYEKNHGKGYAVRYGMARAKGSLIAFIDSGMELNPNGLSMLLEHMIWYEADVMIGSKRHPASKVVYPLKRRFLSFLYQTLIYVLFGLKVRDTQVGLKLFRRRVLEEVLPRLIVKRFAFDLEILAVARYLGFNRIYEAPVQLRHNFGSTIKLTDMIEMLKDTLAIFYRLRILRYYADGNKRKWIYDPDLDLKVNVI